MNRERAQSYNFVQKGEIDFTKLTETSEVDKIKHILFRICEETARNQGQQDGGWPWRGPRWQDWSDEGKKKQVEEAIDKLVVFDNPAQMFQFIDHSDRYPKKRAHRYLLRTFLWHANGMAYVVQKDAMKIPAIMVAQKNKNSEETLLHELQHIADDLLGILDKQKVRSANLAAVRAVESRYIFFASTLGASAISKVSYVSHSYEELVPYLLGTAVVSGVLYVGSALQYLMSEHEQRAEKTAERVSNITRS